jgi:hypothetical protein
MQTLTFSLSHPSRGHSLGHALVCPAARYAAVLWLAAPHIERRVVGRAHWQLLDLEIVTGLSRSILESQHVIPRMLLDPGRRAFIVVRLLDVLLVEPAQARPSEQLDGMLRRLSP